MYRILFLIYFVQFVFSNSVNNDVFSEDELLLAVIVHRHGDRTPDPDEIILAEDPELISKLSFPDGVTGLTLDGKRRAYKLGKFLRHRYGNQNGPALLSDLYLEEDIAPRSTDLPRTKMTLLALLAAIYPPVAAQQWSDDLGAVWQPVPYKAVPNDLDYLRFTSNCARYKNLLAEASSAASRNEFPAFEELAVILLNKTGYNFTEKPLLYASLHDLFRAEANIGITQPEWAEPIRTRLNVAAKVAYDLYMKNDEMKTLATGVILDDFLKTSQQIISGEPVSQRVRIFTSHDYNVGALMVVSKVPLNGIPDYCSMFALELRRSPSGKYYVLPVYLNKAGESQAVEMEIGDCGPQCSIDKFRQITEKFAITEDEYFNICKK